MRNRNLRQRHAETYEAYIHNFVLHKSSMKNKESMGKIEFPLAMSMKYT